jgi:hypothetical protein
VKGSIGLKRGQERPGQRHPLKHFRGGELLLVFNHAYIMDRGIHFFGQVRLGNPRNGALMLHIKGRYGSQTCHALNFGSLSFFSFLMMINSFRKASKIVPYLKGKFIIHKER